MNIVKIGFSEVDITPELGYPLGGYFERFSYGNSAKGVLNRIYTRTMYISDENIEVIVNISEVLALESEVINKIRESASSETGIPKKNIIIGATHTHSAPDTFTSDILLFTKLYSDKDRKKICEYLDWLRKRIVYSIAESKYAAKNVSLGFFRAHIENVCSNRVDPSLPGDTDLDFIGNPKIGALIVYPCHPTILGADNLLYSGDLYSFAAEKLKADMNEGFIPIFANGAAGDLSTRFNRKNQSVDEAKRLGSMLADQILRSMKLFKEIDQGRIELKEKILLLPKRDVEAEGIKEKGEKLIIQLKETLKKTDLDPATRRKLQQDLMGIQIILSNLDAFKEELNKLPEKIPVELKVLTIGDKIAIVFLPGEFFSAFSRTIKSRSRYELTSVVGYTNGYWAYVPTKESYEKIEYETAMSILSPGSGELITQEVLKLLG